MEKEPTIDNEELTPEQKLQSFKDEYDKLDRKGHPTAEDEARAAELEKKIRELEKPEKSQEESTVDRELRSLMDEYKELDKKGYPTAEDEARAAEIEKRIRELEELKKTETEKKEEEEKEEDPKELPKDAKQEMSREAQEKYESLTPKGKTIANRFYHFIYKVPGLGKLVSGLAIWDGQRMASANERRMAKAKGKMDSIDLTIGAYKETKEELESLILDYEKEGIPGAEELKMNILKIERNIEEQLRMKDEARSEFDEKENRAKHWANKRNEVAETMLGVYGEKLAPLERELSGLGEIKKQLDLSDAIIRARHAKLSEEIVALEKREAKIAAVLEKAGMSKKNEGLKILRERREEKEALIRSEKEELRIRYAEIDKKIMRVDEKASVYRDERDNLTRVKNRKSLEVILEERKRVEDESERKDVKSHKRESFEGEGLKRFDISEIVKDWTGYIKEEFGDSRDELALDDRFIDTVCRAGNKDFTTGEFKDILVAYGVVEGIEDIEEVVNRYQSKLE